MRKRTLAKRVVSALSAFALLGAGGCTGATEPAADVVDGGTTDRTDYGAPKKIASKALTDFSAHFLLQGEWSPGKADRFYTLEVKRDEHGIPTATVWIDTPQNAKISAPADEALMTKLQAIIDAQNLAAKNGVYRVTAGLPPEFDECRFSAGYASGETLAFTENNNPDAAWAKETYLAFADWFAARGDDTLLPPRLEGKVARLTLRFTDGSIHYNYGDWQRQEQDAPRGETRRVLMRSRYDEATRARELDDAIPFPEDIYDEISAIVARHDLRPFDRGSVLFGRGRKNPPDRADPRKAHLLALHIKYENGHIVNIDTSDPEDIEKLRPLLSELFACQDARFEKSE